MIRLNENLYIGNSRDAEMAGNGETTADIGGLLNAAVDLYPPLRTGKVEYMHAGLIDGPGNEVADYVGALFCLKALARRHKRVLVYDHDGCRALVVAAMLLNLKAGQVRATPTAWSHWPTWAECFEAMRPGAGQELPTPCAAHVEAFNRIPWGLICVV